MANQYGTDIFTEIVDHIWPQMEDHNGHLYFGYPDYLGLPNRIIDRLYQDAVCVSG